MRSGSGSRIDDLHDGPGRVSSRLLSELWLTLARHGIPPTELLGDLPIAVDERGLVKAPVHWDHFNLFLRRLERRVGGPEGLERCGEWLGRERRNNAFSGLVALATSPLSLYRAAATWAAPRAMPGVVIELTPVSPNHLTLDVHVPEALGPCSPILHVTAGIYRTLPGLLGMPDAVVESRIDARHARYDITVPSSRTLVARLRRLVRSMLTPGTVLRQLEDRQLELSARLTQLTRAHAELAASESRLRALSDAAVDVLCELDESGRIVFASASVYELMGYAPEQIVGSHYRLWVPTPLHALANARFEALRSAPVGTAVARRWIELHAAHGRRIGAEASVRSHLGTDGRWRVVVCLRAAQDASRDATGRARALRPTAPPRPLAASPAAAPATRASGPATSPIPPRPIPPQSWSPRHASRKAPEIAPPALAPPALDSSALDSPALDSPADIEPAGSIDRLRRGLDRVRQRRGGHPLERSLPELVSLLEAFERDSGPRYADRLVDSTQRMTRIVEHTLLGESGGLAPAQWHETRKRVDHLRERWRERLEANEIELSLDVSRAPAELYGSEPLLEACLVGLLDWAVERSPARRGVDGPGHIALSLAPLPPTADDAPPDAPGAAAHALRIMVVVAVTERVPGLARPLRGDGELSLALAADAARAMGGVLEEPVAAPEAEARAIRLPQPDPATGPARERPSPAEPTRRAGHSRSAG
ncbi:MAG: PAS domain S-box protein [Myxococcota bacterium]